MFRPDIRLISKIAAWLIAGLPLFSQMAFATVVSAGGHTAVIGNDGTLRLAGGNESGQLGTGDLFTRFVFIPQALPEWQAVWTARGVTFA